MLAIVQKSKVRGRVLDSPKRQLQACLGTRSRPDMYCIFAYLIPPMIGFINSHLPPITIDVIFLEIVVFEPKLTIGYVS